MASAGTREQKNPQKAQSELVALEKDRFDVEGDPEAVGPILADDFLHVLPVGIVTKKEQIAFLRKHPSHDQSSRHS